jgi:hypothetical protein
MVIPLVSPTTPQALRWGATQRDGRCWHLTVLLPVSVERLPGVGYALGPASPRRTRGSSMR